MYELRLESADDSSNYSTTFIRINDKDNYETVRISPRGYRTANNPMIEAIKQWLTRKLGVKRDSMYRKSWRANSHWVNAERKKETVEFTHNIYIGMEGYVIHFHKRGSRYYINGLMGNKSVLMAALARTIFKSCFTDDGLELEKFMVKHITLPENVSYALENRAPYYFYLQGDDGYYNKRIECRLKVNLISDKKVAIEISDGIWGEMTVKQMNTYMNTYLKKKKQGSWSNLSPSELWFKVMKEEITEAQEHLMISFLNQNRTSKVVKERARDLMIHIAKRYPDRVAINWGDPETKLLDQKDKPTIMYIRGKLADWKLTDRGLKSQGQQNVSTYIWTETEQSDLEGFADEIKMKGGWDGPICVDNLNNKSPTGDQFVTRALGLLNDNVLGDRVSTIRRHLKGREIGQTSQRIPNKVFEKKRE